MIFTQSMIFKASSAAALKTPCTFFLAIISINLTRSDTWTIDILLVPLPGIIAIFQKKIVLIKKENVLIIIF